MKWYDQILASLKSFFSMEHDATEQEVHEKLQSAKNLNDFKAETKKALETQIREEMKAEVAKETKRADDAEKALEKANEGEKALKSGVAEMESRIEKLNARITEHEATIETLKKKPATEHSNGPAGEVNKRTGERAYNQDSATLRARKFRTEVKAKPE